MRRSMQLISVTHFWGGVMVVMPGQCICLKSLANPASAANKKIKLANRLQSRPLVRGSKSQTHDRLHNT